jgi:hypothetical protein
MKNMGIKLERRKGAPDAMPTWVLYHDFDDGNEWGVNAHPKWMYGVFSFRDLVNIHEQIGRELSNNKNLRDSIRYD